MGTNTEPILAFVLPDHPAPAIEIRVNFGIFAGREVTPAEIDRLAQWLLDEVDAVTIVAEERHEIGRVAEASTHQVRVEIAETGRAMDFTARRRREERVLERVDYWARTCIAERHAEG
jgi:hypothetical protein